MPGLLFITTSSSQSLIALQDTCREEAVTGGEKEVGVLQHRLSLVLALQVLLPGEEGSKHFLKSVGIAKPEEGEGGQRRILLLRKPLEQMAQYLHCGLLSLEDEEDRGDCLSMLPKLQ